MLTDQIKESIKEHTFKEQPKECCGLIVQKDENCTSFPCKNDSNEPNKFRVNCSDYLKCSFCGDIKALYHSHFNSPDFSLYDKQQAKINNLKYILYFVPDNKFNIFDPLIDNLSNYIGRKYQIGVQDCFTLVRDYYKKELNKEIFNYERDENWKNISPLIDLCYKKEGFKEVNDLKKHDIILFKFRRDFSEHCAVYLGDNLMLHQPVNGLSKIEPIDRYKRYINHIIRL